MSKDSEVKKLLEGTLEAFFFEARNREQEGGLEMAIHFIRDCIFGCTNDGVREAYKSWAENKAEMTRMVEVDFEIASRQLSHEYDLHCFTEALEDVFQWFEAGREGESKKVGPYLCFVQSSGMGKTKLMYEYRKKSFDVKSDIASCLILSSDILSTKKKTLVFDFRENFRKATDRVVDLKVAALRIYEVLDKFLKETLKKNVNVRTQKAKKEAKDEKRAPQQIKKCRKVVLMFDESQSYVKRDNSFDAFLFRCVRVWLREHRHEKVIAVFAGTTSKITNFLVESDSELEPTPGSSREIQKGAPVEYYDKGSNQLFPPFYHTATMGSCLQFLAGVTEYERAVFYGRPLFAIMANKNILNEKISNVLCRMLIVTQGCDWKDELIAVMNCLATRVQLGETSFDVVSKLVAMAYANLSGCTEDSRTLQLAYLPDPVCARLAMCMMDEDFRQVAPEWKTTIKGKEKVWWSQKMKEIFSTGLVRPSKGDFGEVVVALYMLFCGDLLRKEISDTLKKKDKDKMDYSQFSVSLDAWLDLLASGGRPCQEKIVAECDLSVGFIQVCRNSMRSYRTSWESLKDDSFLKHIFESGVAFYVFEGCPLIDMVVPMRVNRQDGDPDARPKISYVPLLVSIKSLLELDQSEAEKACAAMKQKASNSGLTVALCLLIAFGSESPSSNYTGEIAIQSGTAKVSRQLLDCHGKGHVIAKAVQVPTDDVFKLTEMFLQMTPDSQVNTELFSSHSFIMAHGDGRSKSTDLLADKAVCATSRSKWKQKYGDLRKAMTKVLREE